MYANALTIVSHNQNGLINYHFIFPLTEVPFSDVDVAEKNGHCYSVASIKKTRRGDLLVNGRIHSYCKVEPNDTHNVVGHWDNGAFSNKAFWLWNAEQAKELAARQYCF